MDFEKLGRSFHELGGNDILSPLFYQLLVIVGAGLLLGELFYHYLRQPRTVGHIAAGLLLGPSFLGRFWPHGYEVLFRPSEAGVVASVAVTKVLALVRFSLSELGLIFLLFGAGLMFSYKCLKHKGTAAGAISLAGITAPFVLGIGVALFWLCIREEKVSTLAFCLALGMCMSITALPILATFMDNLGITQTRLGTITISAAASDDALAWIALGSLTALLKNQFNVWDTIKTVVATLTFVLIMATVVRRIFAPFFVRKLAESKGRFSPSLVAGLFLFMLVAGIATHLIGIFALFGAFLSGAVLSEVKGLREACEQFLKPLTDYVLLPIFFTFTGLQTNIGSLESPVLWLLCGLVILAAVTGKLGGCYCAARWSGFSKRESLCAGALMNCRALMGLIAANMCRDLGALTETAYCMLILMAVVTTYMTTPLVLWFMPGTELEGPIRRSGFMPSVVQKARKTKIPVQELVHETVS